jgi:hypothetical protein
VAVDPVVELRAGEPYHAISRPSGAGLGRTEHRPIATRPVDLRRSLSACALACTTTGESFTQSRLRAIRCADRRARAEESDDALAQPAVSEASGACSAWIFARQRGKARQGKGDQRLGERMASHDAARSREWPLERG